MLQGYFSVSSSPDGFFVLGGYISDADRWSDFSLAWEQALPLCKTSAWEIDFDVDGKFGNPDASQIPLFYQIIEEYTLCQVSCVIDVAELRRVVEQLKLERVLTGPEATSNYYLSLLLLFNVLNSNGPCNADLQTILEKAVGSGSEIEMYFSDRVNRGEVFWAWAGTIFQSPNLRRPMNREPFLRDFTTCLPLQAAHFCTWWVRRAFEEGTVDNIKNCHFKLWKERGSWKGTKIVPNITIYYNENQMVEFVKRKLSIKV